jgi:hypothetical protein
MRATAVITATAVCILNYFNYRSDLFCFKLFMFRSLNFDNVTKATKALLQFTAVTASTTNISSQYECISLKLQNPGTQLISIKH